MIDLRRILPLNWPTDSELQDDEYRHPPRREPAPGFGTVRYAPPRVAWTDEPPRTPGLYFVRLSPSDPCRVVEVYHQHDQLMAAWSDIDPFPVAHCGYQFSDHRLLEPR